MEGNGGSRVFASASTESYGLPFIMAEACVPQGEKNCADFRPPDPAAEKWEWCSGVTAERIARTDSVAETRWICPPAKFDGREASFGASVFNVNGAVLYVAYAAGGEDVPAKLFLDGLSRSLRVVSR